MTIERYLTAKQAMEYTGLGIRSLDGLMDKKIIRLYGSRGRKFYDKTDIDTEMETLKGRRAR